MSIIQYRSLELKDILYYKQAKFIFKPGITIIRGLNKNSELKKNTNGVGKSLLFSCIPNILFATTPLAKKNDKKSLFRSANSEIKFRFKKENIDWTIIQRSKKSGIDYDILKNGESINPRTVAIAEQKIKDLFGISEELFYTKDYISIQRPHLFLRGTSTQRQEFFTEVFKLDHYDKLKSSFQLQLRELKSKKIKLDLLKDQYSEVLDKLTNIAWDNKKEKQINELETKVNDLNKSYITYVTTITDLQAQLRLAIDISKREKKLGNITLESIKKKQKQSKELLKSVQEYNEYKRAEKKYLKDTKSLQDRLNTLEKELKEIDTNDGEYGLDELDGRIEKLASKRSALKLSVSRLEGLRDEYAELDESLPEGKIPRYTLEQLNIRIGELKQILELNGAISKVSKNCPLCGSNVSKTTIKLIADSAKDELPKRKQDLLYVKTKDKMENLKKEGKLLSGCEGELEEVEKKLRDLEKKKKSIEKRDRLKSSISDIKKSLRKILKPEIVDNPGSNKSEDELESQIQGYSTNINSIKDLQDIKDEYNRGYEFCEVSEIEGKLDKIKKVQTKAIGEINKINEVLPRLLSQQTQVIEHTKTKEELGDKIEKIETGLQDLPVLEALIKAYGSKGLKVEVMKKIATLVEVNLNKYSSLIFSEPFSFKIEIAENSFSVMVDRKGLVSDISKLSGAEGASFTLLLLLSMLPLIPRRLRADTIILDEVDAYLGPPLKTLFFTKFLPVLNSVVPKICVITTAGSQLKVENARNILVEKEGQVTSLKEMIELEGIL